MTRVLAKSIAAAFAVALSSGAFAGSIAADEQAEMAAVLQAPISPTKAVQIAESGGGRPYGYGMEATAHSHWYEVDVVRNGSRLNLRIDAETGKLIGSTRAHGEDTQGAHALDGSQLTLGRAIAKAERVGGGPALEAGAVGHGKQAHVDVDVIQDRGRRIAHYRVSLHNGQLDTVKTGATS